MGKFESMLGRVVAKERLAAGLTQELLAYRSGLHPTYVSQVERGVKSPTVRVLLAIAGALGSSASELIRKAEIREQNQP